MTPAGAAAPDLSLVPQPRLDLAIRNHRGMIVLGWGDTFLELEDVAAFIWRQVDGVRPVGAIVSAVTAEYEVDDEQMVVDDVWESLETLRGANFIRLVSPAEAAVQRHWF